MGRLASLRIFGRLLALGNHWYLWLLLAAVGPTATATGVQRGDVPRAVYIGTVPLATLQAGGAGRGVFLYVLPGKPVDQPSLVVVLQKATGADVARANVYEAPGNLHHIPVRIHSHRVSLARPIRPAISLEALGGWWVRNGKVNYNLNVQVNTPSYSIWGASYAPGNGFGGSASGVRPGTPFVSIRVRDPKNTGTPKWDLRELVPPFSRKAVVRTSYVESECQAPLQHKVGVSPAWPYVAKAGGFEQPVGALRPPIVVDWATGKVTYFSELVTARNQNCSYTIYSISRLDLGSWNKADFEAPFAFYDLSGKGQGYPNLIIRAEHYPAGDRWSTGVAPNVLNGAPVDSPFEAVRYSWSDHVGNGTCDYKIGVMGNHEYAANTPIASGAASITAPSYSAFPNWVIKRPWPVTTLVSTEGNKYKCTEGIYEWSPREVGAPYFLGQDSTPNSDAFKSIRDGLRGEFRIGKGRTPQVYVSPVDNRLHLLGADGGVLNLGERWVLHLENLAGGPYLDSWQLTRSAVKTTPGAGSHGAMDVRSLAAPASARPARLVQMGDFLIYSESGQLLIKKANARGAELVTQPPTDQESWRTFIRATATYRKARRNPFNMRGWLDAFSGPSLEVDGATLTNVYGDKGDEGLRFVVSIRKDSRLLGGLRIPAFSDLHPGMYVFSYSPTQQRWERQAATPPKIAARLRSGELVAFQPTRISLTISNAGTVDYRGPLTLVIDGNEARSWNQVTVPGAGSISLATNWAPNRAGRFTAGLQLRGSLLKLEPIQVAPDSAPGPQAILGLGRGTGLLLTGLVLLLSASIVAFWWQTRTRA